MPEISIVLPTYNGEKYIRESIDSILAQTFTDWELIIVDDCSTDSTPEIIKEYAERDDRIRIIHNEKNLKLPASLNVGFRTAKGKYYTWTSDDNAYHQDALEKMHSFLEIHKKHVMVCSRIQFVDAAGACIGISEEYNDERMCYSNCVGACFLYRETVRKEIGDYSTNMFLIEDYEYWFRILTRYRTIGFINEVLYLYRTHDSSLTATRRNEIMRRSAEIRKKHLAEIVEMLRNRPDYLCGVYYWIQCFFELEEPWKTQIEGLIDELLIDNQNEMDEKVIVYGAGGVGKEFAKRYADHILYFADKSEEKVGRQLFGVDIVDLERMRELSNQYQIVVAASIDNVYSFLVTLKSLGIKNCFVFKETWT